MAKKAARAQAGLSPVRKSIRQLFSSADLRHGLVKARTDLSHAHVPEFIERIMQTPQLSTLLTQSLFPSDLTALRPVVPAHTPLPARDFIWSAKICQIYSEKLNQFVVMRNIYENKFLTGEYTEALECLEQIHSKFGYSLWYIDCKIQCIQLLSGLTSQKNYLESIVVQNIHGIVGYVAYNFSIRAEPDVSKATMESLLNSLSAIAPQARLYFGYLTDPSNVNWLREETHKLIHAFEFAALIDRYQVLIRCIALEVSRAGHQSADYIRHAIKLLSKINEPALCSVNKLMFDSTIIGKQDDMYVAAFDAYTAGNYELCYSQCQILLEKNPSEFSLYQLMTRAQARGGIAVDYSSENSLISSISSAMFDLETYSSSYDSAIDRIEKIVLTIPHTVLAVQLTAYLKRDHNFEANCAPSHLDRLWATLSSTSNPWHIHIVEELSRSHAALLLSRYAGSISYQLRSALSADRFEKANNQIRDLPLPASRQRASLAQSAATHQKWDLVIELLQQDLFTDDVLTTITAQQGLFGAYLAEAQPIEAMRLVCDSYYKNPLWLHLFDLRELIEYLAKTTLPNEANIVKANILSLATRYLSKDFEGALSNVFEDCLDGSGVTRTSSLLDQPVHPLRDWIYFVRYVSTIRTMEDCTNFETIDDIEDERLRLCSWLTVNDPDNANDYAQEIRQITRTRQKGLLYRQLDNSKLYVDETGIREMLHPVLEDCYKRFRELLRTPDLDYQSEKIKDRLGKLLANIDSITADKVISDLKKIRLPSTERQGLVLDTYQILLDRFLFSPEYGLDTHLSANVRHGTFIGHVRSCLAVHHLVTLRDATTGDYRPNEFWPSKLHHLGGASAAIAREMTFFSKRFDTLLQEVNDTLLHVRRPEKPAALLDFSDIETAAAEIMHSTHLDTTFEEFVDSLFESAWRQAASSLSSVQTYLKGPFANEANRQFDLLLNKIEMEANRNDVPELLDAIAQARTDFNIALERVSEWFKRPEMGVDQPHPFDMVVEVAEQEIRNCYGGTALKLAKVVEASSRVSGRRLIGFVDILFILLQNAIVHSGQSTNTDIEIELIQDGPIVVCKVKNSLSPTLDRCALQSAIDAALTDYNASKAISRVRSEGGSGMSKVWRTAEYILKASHHEARMYLADGSFSATVEITLGEPLE